ncbi:Bax inhibitor-1/YccA family protein [Sphingobium nicotianae]|uniref:Bax inhibitor-1/YccA family protein n=1 Tax=Sphingobium nicotianae TaxID=2782607 RepID=A0A9X1DER7_9SPHN|nr:Bax inhibitor-1/YccA family protein [Sphingobium nicotianae]MBT2188711.1 Bax inhibitor-1/YccA family protein [Sphingobium nicotianae]
MYEQNRTFQRGAIQNTAAFDAGLRAHMLRIYNFMASGVLVTGIVALIVASTPALREAVFGTPLKWVFMLAPLAFVFFFSFRIDRMSAASAQAAYWAFAATMGVSMASVFLVFTGMSIAQTFFVAAGMFTAMSLYGYTTKADLSRFGSFLVMGVVGILIAMLVNLFLGSSVLQMAISILGVLIFTGLTAWDTQNIKSQYAHNLGHETETKMAVFGALSLYLNFVNIFQFLLSLMGERE